MSLRRLISLYPVLVALSDNFFPSLNQESTFSLKLARLKETLLHCWWERKLIESLWRTSTAAAAAKSLQSCPTLCDPIDGSSPGSPVPGILRARTLEWVAISFSNA